jgi:hypothetical protein
MLTQKQLSKMVCTECECDSSVLWLHSRCHPEAPTWTRYHRDGFLIVTCSVCEMEIVKILVAEDERTV